MTRMAGANPKIAAIFGGGDFGMDYDKMNQQAYSSQSDLSQAATAADARAFMTDREAENMVKMAKMEAKAMGSGDGGMGMAGQALGAVGQAAGLFGGGGGGGASFLGTSASPGGAAGVAGIGGGSMVNPFTSGGSYLSLM